jgi:hypothetical protein
LPTVTLGALGQRLEAIGSRIETLEPLLTAGALMAVAEVKDRFNTSLDADGKPFKPLQYPRPDGSAKPLQDQGILAAATTFRLIPFGFQVGNNRPQSRLMQLGGKVRPVAAKFLAIPLTKRAKLARSPRRFPEPLIPLVRGISGVLTDSGGTPQYGLTKEVTVPARKYMGVSVELLAKFRRATIDYFLYGRL